MDRLRSRKLPDGLRSLVWAAGPVLAGNRAACVSSAAGAESAGLCAVAVYRGVFRSAAGSVSQESDSATERSRRIHVARAAGLAFAARSGVVHGRRQEPAVLDHRG